MTQSSPLDVDLAVKRLNAFVDAVNGLDPTAVETLSYFDGGGMPALISDLQALLAHRTLPVGEFPTTDAGDPIFGGRVVFGDRKHFLSLRSAKDGAVTIATNGPNRIEMITGYALRIHFNG